jgi:hypothetical protein
MKGRRRCRSLGPADILVSVNDGDAGARLKSIVFGRIVRVDERIGRAMTKPAMLLSSLLFPTQRRSNCF